MRFWLRSVGVILCPLIFGSFLFAQGGGLTGRILHWNGTPVAKAKVRLWSQDSNIKPVTVKTDSVGAFSIHGLAQGGYLLEAWIYEYDVYFKVFDPVRGVADIDIQSVEPVNIDLTLNIITVRVGPCGPPLVDTSSTTTGMVFSVDDYLDDLPLSRTAP